MKIAIMGAMQEEIAPLLEYFKDYKTVEFANNQYYTTTYKGLELVIAYSKIGKVNASLTATTLIEKFGAQQLFFSGVAGAVNPKLKIGDLVVATQLVQHDLDISVFGHPYGFVPGGNVFTSTTQELREQVIKVAKKHNKTVLEGIIATGDQFICDNAKKEWIKTTFNADAIEMEGASVAVVCHALNVPFCIIRAISDAADKEADFSFDTFLETAVKESAALTIDLMDSLAHD